MSEKSLSETFPFLRIREGGKDGIESFYCPHEKLLEVASFLQKEYEFKSLNDIASIDEGENSSPRFACIYHFFSHIKKVFLRLYVYVDDSGLIPSLCRIYPSANWFEREAFDMMGIKFSGHPEMKKILMWDEYPWNPLKKDFPLCGKEAPLPESFDGNENVIKITSAPMVGGPFYSESDDDFSPDKEPRSRETL